MANVLNKTTMDYLVSVHTPDYCQKDVDGNLIEPIVSLEDWLINPDMSAVDGVEPKYWKLDESENVVEMSQAEKDDVDAAEAAAPFSHKPLFHATSKLVGMAEEITETGSWQELGGAVTTPDFFTDRLPYCKARVIGEYRATGTGAQLLFRESGVDVGTFDMDDTAGVWTPMQWFPDGYPTEGTHTYTLLGNLDGATSAAVRFTSVSLLEFV